MSKVLIRMPEVIKRTGIGRSAIYAAIAKGKFPPPVKIGERASAWVEDEISEWIEERISASRTGRVA